jgi:hypothetical protein
MHDLHAQAQPVTSIVMVGDFPLPIDPPIAPPGPAFPIPGVGNPLPVIQQDLQYAWDDVSGWVKGIFHSAVGDVKSIVNFDLATVRTMIDTAISIEQTAWANFVSQLRDWIVNGLYDAAASTLDLALTARKAEVWLFNHFEGAIDGVLLDVFNVVVGIDRTINADILNLEHLIEYDSLALRTWAIDNIYDPLSKEIEGLGARTLGGLETVLADAEAYARSLTHDEALRRAAAIAGIAAAAAAIATWVAECGEPMCEQLGPKTDWGKWLKRFGPLALWAMLAAVAAEDPRAIENLAADLARTLGPVLESWSTSWAIGGGGFPSQPGPVGGAIGGNPLGL